ncbi:MAG TPA: DUF2905 domain-containing protein [Anaerolineae bacterium]|nr:DUF2905 domain-containing protein [Anaerolineae bacterium]HMR66146.1 DUF2905 domain-containing protein [Anaerolineae bacterium]
MENIGKLILGLGVILVVLGLCVWLLGDRLTWFGRLPGDIVIERPNFRFYFPLTTMIILSLALSLIVSIISRLLR